MRTLISAAVVVSALSTVVLPAQTTGVPFMNDYTINCTGCSTAGSTCWSSGVGGGSGGVSGSTSCTPLFFNLSAGGTFTFTVTANPGAQVFILTNPCACSPCFLWLAPICGVPFTACGATTNQSVDLDLTCPLNTLFSGFANGFGVYSVTVTVPPLPPGFCTQMSTQAAILGSIACAGPIVVTQAYDVLIG